MDIHFGKNIKRLRVAAGLNQKELGERFEVKSSTVGGWETGNSFPEFKVLLGLREFFDVNLELLVFSDLSANAMPTVGEPLNKYHLPPPDPEVKAAIEKVRELESELSRLRGEVGKMGVMDARLQLLERQLELVIGEMKKK